MAIRIVHSAKDGKIAAYVCKWIVDTGIGCVWSMVCGTKCRLYYPGTVQ